VIVATPGVKPWNIPKPYMLRSFLGLYARNLGLDSTIKHYGGVGAMVIHGAVETMNLVEHGDRGIKKGCWCLEELGFPT